VLAFEARKRHIGAHAVLSIAVAVSITPLIWTLWTSLKNQADAQAYPPSFDARPILDNYNDIIGRPDFREALVNSLVVTAASVCLAIVVAFTCAYALVRLQVPGRRLLMLLIVLVLTMPGMVLVVPLFYIATETGLFDTRLLVTLVYAALIMPFSTLILVGFLKRAPIELEEAARVDGASRLQVLWKIVVPIARPGIGAAAIFAGIAAWNEYLVPLFLTRTSARPLTVWISSSFVTQKTIAWGPLSAATMLVILPIIVTVVALQRHLVAGLTAGSTKG
jgi:ABC-type glycerol-3-phosphate transport system permease component